jgi:hypothetical protein
MTWSLPLFVLTLFSFVPPQTRTSPAGGKLSYTGVVVRYAPQFSTRSEGDLILRVVSEREAVFVRIRYVGNHGLPEGPSPGPSDLLPANLLSNLMVWNLVVHRPMGRWEQSTCGSEQKAWAPGADGKLVEVERYDAVAGREREQVPDWRTLPCVILERWEPRTKPEVSK